MNYKKLVCIKRRCNMTHSNESICKLCNGLGRLICQLCNGRGCYSCHLGYFECPNCSDSKINTPQKNSESFNNS